MLESIAALPAGLELLLTWPTPLYLVAGILIGYVVGILPGLGGPASLSFMLPAIVTLSPIDGLVLLTAAAAVTIGAGDLTSIVLGVPGEASAAAIVADGHAMARRGEGGRAAGAAIGASLLGAAFGIAVLLAVIPIAQRVFTRLQSPELAMLALFGVCLVVPLSRADPVKGLLAGAFGLALSTIGLDPSKGEPRFTFGQPMLWDGLTLLPVALAVFAVPEALRAIRSARVVQVPSVGPGHGVLAGCREAFGRFGLVLRCSGIGAAIGALPGVGASVSQWMAYGHAAQTSKDRVAFGAGAIDGVIGPASATAATLGGALVPTLSLGIPGSLTTGLLLSAFIIKGMTPGPAMLAPDHAGGHLTLVLALVWCLVIAGALGGLISLVSVGHFARLAAVRPSRLAPIVLTLILIGTVGERHVSMDLGILVLLGVFGYALLTLDWPRAPLMLGLILGPLLERRLLLSNQIFGWSWLVRPSVLIMGASVVAFLVMSARSKPGAAPSKAARAPVRGDLVLSSLLALGAAAAFWHSVSLTGRPGFFPRLAFGATLGLALVEVVRTLRTVSGAGATIDRPASRRAVHRGRLGWFLALALSAWLLGLVVGTTVSVAAYLRWEARESWRTTVVFTVALVLLVRFLVTTVLQMSDQGRLFAWLSLAFS